MDFLSRQKKLQAEAKLALAMAKPMAKMQVEVEKQNRKKSPVADLVSGTVTLNIRALVSRVTEAGRVVSFIHPLPVTRLSFLLGESIPAVNGKQTYNHCH